MRNACAVVLAGGRSSRMGFDKATLVLEGEPLIARVVQSLRREFPSVAIVAKSAGRYRDLVRDDSVALVEDGTELQNPLSGLVAGLSWAPCDVVFACAVDMPFAANAALLDRLEAGLGPDCDAAAFSRDGVIEPLHAFYRRDACLSVAQRLLKEGRGPRHVLQAVRTVLVSAPAAALRAALLDLDTPEDAVRARNLLDS